MGREFKRGLRLLRVYALGVGYLSVVYLVMVAVALSPAYALQNPTVNYSRVVAQAEMIAAKAFQRATIADAVAAAAIVPTPVGLGIKALALGLTVGVPLGLALRETYYPSAKLAAIKAAAAPSTGSVIAGGSGLVVPAGHRGTCPITIPITYQDLNHNTHNDVWDCSSFGGGSGTSLIVVLFSSSAAALAGTPSGWTYTNIESNGGDDHYYGQPSPTYRSYYRAGANQWTDQAGTPATKAQVSTYVQGLASTDPNSIEANTVNQGVGAAAPAHEVGTQVVTIVNNIDNSTHVVQAPAPGDVVVNPSVPPPAQTTITNNTTNNNTSTVTTTTTTTNNQNGSTTTVATSSDTQTSVSPCVTQGHQPDTLGSTLARHQAAWKTSGLVSTLTQLQGLAWAGTPPVLSLSTHLFGTFTVDFGASSWAFVYVVMRTIFLAAAGLVSVRIVFGSG